MAPVILELRRATDRFEHLLLSTARHREMLDSVFRAFRIKPDLDLNLMQPNQSLADLTARAILVPLKEVGFPAESPPTFQLTDAAGQIHRIPFHRVRNVSKDSQRIWHRGEPHG
jgi:MJ1316 RNA cyclic group end recognition domain